MPKVSILTPTIRPLGLDIVRNSLKKQSFQDYEWIIGSPFVPFIPEKMAKECEDSQRSRARLQGYAMVSQTPSTQWIPDDFTGGFWSLNRMMNKMIKHSNGEILVSWQDYIWAPSDALEKFVTAVEKTGGIVSGIGDQFERVGRYGVPEIMVWEDPRKTQKYGSFYESLPSDNEWNFCSFTRDAIFDVGGFCEILDTKGFGMDGYQVNERLDVLGYKFYLDQTNISYTVRHNRDSYGGDERWNKNNNLTNGQYEKVRQECINKGEWPRMKYLV